MKICRSLPISTRPPRREELSRDAVERRAESRVPEVAVRPAASVCCRAVYYPNCEFLIVERLTGSACEPIGRLYVDRWADQIRVVDVSLVPGHRGQGHGTALLREVMSEGAEAGLPVTIHVESTNPAMGLPAAGLRSRRLQRRVPPDEVESPGQEIVVRRQETGGRAWNVRARRRRAPRAVNNAVSDRRQDQERGNPQPADGD